MQDKIRRDSNPETTKASRRTPKYKAAARASANKRRAAKLKQSPAWAKEDAIKSFYANCPEGYEVDHIIPLMHSDVAGLHVLTNLQYLPEGINKRKSNKILECYSEHISCSLEIERYL